MPWFDLPLASLREHRTAAEEPPGLDGWWAERMDEARAAARPPGVTRYATDAYGPLHAYDVEFSGARGDRIRGWYLRPAGAGDAQLPLVVQFIGYGGGRGLPASHSLSPRSAMPPSSWTPVARAAGGPWALPAT